MRIAGALASTVVAGLVVCASTAQGADECRGLQVCIPIAGPWVVIPAADAGPARFPEALWRLRCPRGSIVGGMDARLRDRTIDVTFSGLTGSPVNPGITTTDEVVFRGVYTGRPRRPTAFRPFIGCIPTSGGERIPTARGAVRPGRPTVVRARSLSFQPGRVVTVTHSCAPGERLVTASQAVGLRTRLEPTPGQLAGVRSTLVRDGGRLVARATVRAVSGRLTARLQVLAVCTRSAGAP